MDGSRPPADITIPTDALGVLFVHGIGRQSQGETLILAANPIYEMLDSLPEVKGKTRVMDCDLRPRTGPGHLRLRFHFDGHPTPPPESWLLAEAHWADAFPPAQFAALVKWSFAVLPWALLSHFGAGVLTGWQALGTGSGLWEKVSGVLQLAQAVALLCAAPVIYLAVQTMFLLAFVIAILPFPGLRSFARSLQQSVASVIGDAYLLSRPVQGAAMTSAILRDLRWLAQRCKKVAVVAHSQGAALSYIALRDDPPDNLAGFITYGSGIRKLGALETAAAGQRLNLLKAWLAVGSMFLVLLALAFIFAPLPQAVATAMAWLSLGLILVSAVAVLEIANQRRSPGLNLLAVAAAGFVLTLGMAWALPIRAGGNPAFFGVHVLMAALILFFSAKQFFRGAPAGSKAGPLISLCATAAAPMLLVAALSRLNVPAPFWEILLSAVVGFPIFLFLGLSVARDQDIGGLSDTLVAIRKSELGWKDWYASRDPIAQGPMVPLGVDSAGIHNRDSFWTDHTTYWENGDEFVPRVAEVALHLRGLERPRRLAGKAAGHEAAQMACIPTRYREVIILAAWLVVLASARTRLAGVGTQLTAFIDEAKRLAPSGLVDLEPFAAPLGSESGRVLAGGILVSVAALVAWLLVASILNFQDRAEIGAVQRRHGFVRAEQRSQIWVGLIFVGIALQSWLDSNLMLLVALSCVVAAFRFTFGTIPERPATDDEEEKRLRQNRTQGAGSASRPPNAAPQ